MDGTVETTMNVEGSSNSRAVPIEEPAYVAQGYAEQTDEDEPRPQIPDHGERFAQLVNYCDSPEVISSQPNDLTPRLTSRSYVANVDVSRVANDGSLDDPEWIPAKPGEVVTGVEGVDWVWNYADRLGPRQYGKMRRNIPTPLSQPGTRQSALQLLVGSEFLRPRHNLLEDRWGGRVIWGTQPAEPYTPPTFPSLGEMRVC
jgi:hypothetical protein